MKRPLEIAAIDKVGDERGEALLVVGRHQAMIADRGSLTHYKAKRSQRINFLESDQGRGLCGEQRGGRRSKGCAVHPWGGSHLATREGYCFQHVQAITVAIDQYAEKALGNRDYFLNKPYGVG
jgi:hypothetical protein